jgi:hypothetical protein
MPISGPHIKPVKHGRNPRFEFRDVPDVANTDYPKLPRLEGVDYYPFTIHWYKTICQMPHAKEWKTSDWLFVHQTAVIFNRWCETLSPVLAREVRIREAILGVTADSRRALRIRYVEQEKEREEDEVEDIDYGALLDEPASLTRYREQKQ